MTHSYNTKKDLLKDLVQYNLCFKRTIDKTEVGKYSDNEDVYVDYQYNNYLCTLDEWTNTRILLGIFKCVNTIKNIMIAGLACGIIGIILSFIAK